MATTMSPNATARALSTPKRTVTPKAVRTMARSILARFDKTRHPEYQSHEYTVAEVATLRKAFAARAGRSAAQPVRKPSKGTARKASAPKVTAIPETVA
jgi:hypothetical protein